MNSFKIPRPPAWLSPGAKQIWRLTAPLIPGFNPALDRTILTTYCVLQSRINEVKDVLRRNCISPQEQRALREFLIAEEGTLYELAGELGLTPGSRLFITRREKRSRGCD